MPLTPSAPTLAPGNLALLGKHLSGNRLLQVSPPQLPLPQLAGYEIGYDQITGSVNITGTTSAAPTAVIVGSPYIFDGSPVVAEFFSPLVTSPSVLADESFVGLYEAGSLVTVLAQILTPAAARTGVPVCSRWRFTPSAGSHTYSIKAWATVATGTPQVIAGAGGAGANAPSYLRFTKA